MQIKHSDELYHYGVPHGKGPTGRGSGRYPWGSGDDGKIRKTSFKQIKNDKGYKNLKNSKTKNVEKFGKDQEHNVLYISGYSGSGKSTVAISIAKKNDKIIHLDSYTENKDELSGLMNADFNKFLNRNHVNYENIRKATNSGENGTLKRFSKEYWDEVDKFRDAVELYGKTEFKKGNRVIVEGVQILDGWLAGDAKYYSDKPSIILSTNRLNSLYRASSRDETGLNNVLKYIKTSKVFKQKIKDFNSDNELIKISKDVIKNIYRMK